MSEQGSIGRGRIVAGGRGAQLLAALEASRRYVLLNKYPAVKQFLQNCVDF